MCACNPKPYRDVVVADDGEEDKDAEPVDERHEHLVHVLEHF